EEFSSTTECKSITLAPAPAPAIQKTPATQGPVFPNNPVSWTLNYSNLGAQALLTPVVEDTLPPGFIFVSATPSPSLVIPGPPTTLRWNLPTLQAPPGVPNSGS